MNKIFKTKYDVTTGQTKVVSELARNRQVASSSGEKPKCGDFWGNSLGVFKVASLAMAGLFGINCEVIASNVVIKDAHPNGWGSVATVISESYQGESSVIIGENTKAPTGNNIKQVVVIGSKASVGDSQAVALGADTFAQGNASIAIGSDDIGSHDSKYKYAKPLSYSIWKLYRDYKSDFANRDNYIIVGDSFGGKDGNDYENGYLKSDNNVYSHTWAKGKGAISIGSRSVAYGNGSTAMGTLALAKGDYSTSIGTGSSSLGEGSIALGNETYVYADYSVGVGTNVQALNNGSMVFGKNSYAGGLGSLALGEYTFANVTMDDEFNKKNADDNIESLYEIGNTAEIQKNTGKQKIRAKTTVQLGSGEAKAEQSKDALGRENQGAIAIGSYAVALGDNTLSLGRFAYAKEDNTMAVGRFAFARDEGAFALGAFSRAMGKNSVALGHSAVTTGQNSFALGYKSSAEGEDSFAFGIESKVDNKAKGGMALGYNTSVTMENSVALGNKSNTKYFYNGTDKTTATLTGTPAIDLDPYIPEGSSYALKTNKDAGIVSVGWEDTGKLGLRRIVGVAPGALDSDVATIGQLKALEYVKREGLVVYYTQEGNQLVKLVKDVDDKKFYRVNTKNGTPIKELGEVKPENVLVGAKGFNEQIVQTLDKDKQTADIGEKIKFGHLKDATISDVSDEAVTGSQLYSVKDVLGVGLNDDNTKLKRHTFEAVNYIDAGQAGAKDTFKEALTEAIAAINSGYKFSDGTTTTDNKFYLGSTIEIKAGDISSNNKKTHSGTNLKTQFKPKDGDNTVAEFTIGLSDTPSFTSVTVTADPTDNKHAVNKAYVDGKLANVAANFTVKGDDVGAGYTLNKDNTELNIKGKQAPNTHQNIKTAVDKDSKTVSIELNKDLKGIESITGKDVTTKTGAVNSKIEFNKSNGSTATTNVTISSNGTNYTFDRTGFDVDERRITRLQSGLNRSHKGQQNTVKTAELSTILDGSYDKNITAEKEKIEKNAVNVGDLSKVAQEILKKELIFQGNGGETDKVTRKLGETLKIVGKGAQANNVTVADNNIKVSKNISSDGLEIGLSDALTGIKSIANGDNAKIVLENDKKTITFTAGDQAGSKDVTLSAGKFSGVSQVGLDDDNGLTFKKDQKDSESADLTVGGKVLTFKKDGENVKISGLGDGQIDGSSGDAITGKQLADLAGKLGVAVNDTAKTGFTAPSFAKVEGGAKNSTTTTYKDAIDDLISAVNKGLTFAGNSGRASRKLGETLTVKGNGTDLTSTADSSSGIITFTLNKAIAVDEKDDKVVTSKAVATALKDYTKTTDLVDKLGTAYLKIDGSNIGDKQADFGGNVGIDEIDLGTDKESTKLVQAKALVKYLKGTGMGSVKISDNPETKATGVGSISIGDKAISENEGSIALGYNAQAKNSGSVSIGKDSNVTGEDAIALGRKNTVSVQSSIAIGETNTVTGVQSYVMGTNNTVSGRENIVFGSRNAVSADNNILIGSNIKIDDAKMTDAIVLGDHSKAEKNAVSVGNDTIKRRIANVAEPTKEYDAANKKYVDARGIKFKGNDPENQDVKLVKLDNVLTIDSSESTVGVNDKGLQEAPQKDINTKIVEEGGQGDYKLVLELNKSEKVQKDDKRAITSDAVNTAINTVKQDLINAEISYKANDAEAKKVKLSDGFNFKDGKNTTAEIGDDGIVKFNLNKELKNMTSFETEAKDGNKAKLDQSGLTVGDSTNGSDKTHATYGKDGLSINGQDGQSAVSLKVKNENGKDTATLEFAKGDGDKATGVIKGLKDLDATADGSSAANKNYVDEKFGEVDKKIAAANTNRPFDYYAGDDKVVKGEDGKFYKEAELKDAKFADGKYTGKDGQDVKTTVKQDDVVIKAEPKTRSMKITNVKDGDLTDKSTDAVNGGQLVKATGAMIDKDGKMTFADGRDGKAASDTSSMANKGLTSKDGLNGQNANDKANALRNGEAGAVVFTDNKGERLVKANDGKYYKATDVDDKGNVKSAGNGQVAPKAVDNPQLSLVNHQGETKAPVVLGNVASGLDIDADKAEEQAENVKKAGEAVKTEAKAVTEKVGEILNKRQEANALEAVKNAQNSAINALETAWNLMPDSTEEEKAVKAKAKANLDAEKAKLADLEKELTKANEAVKAVQAELAPMQKSLEEKQKAYQTALSAKDGAVNKLLSGDASVDVHHGANLQDLQALGQAGLNFEGNDGVPVHKNLGEKLTIKGGGEFNSATTAAGNIKVEASEMGLEIKLSDQLKNMTSFETKETAEGNKARLDGNGLNVTNKDGKSAHYGSDKATLTDGKHNATLTSGGLTFTNPQGRNIEIDGEKGEIRVPDLTPNSSPNAVVNRGYVDSKLGGVENRVNQQFNQGKKEWRAGIAGANAAAALPTVAIPGKSTLALSAGTYKGKNAVAIGYSRLSDNGKITLKLHGNSNSVGDFGGGVGVGWTW